MDVYEGTTELLKPITRDAQKMLKEVSMKTNTKRLNIFTKNRKAKTSGVKKKKKKNKKKKQGGGLRFFTNYWKHLHTKRWHPNMDQGFSREELNFLNKLNLSLPSVVFSETL